MLPKYSNQHAPDIGPQGCRRAENDCPYWVAGPCGTDCADPMPKHVSAATWDWRCRSKGCWVYRCPWLDQSAAPFRSWNQPIQREMPLHLPSDGECHPPELVEQNCPFERHQCRSFASWPRLRRTIPTCHLHRRPNSQLHVYQSKLEFP